MQVSTPHGHLALGPLAARHAMSALHHSGNAHLGLQKTLDKFLQRFIADNDCITAKQVLSNCHGCQMGSDYTHRPVPPGSISSSSPWHTLAIVFMGPFTASHGYLCVLSAIDVFSRYVILIPTPDHLATMAARCIYECIIASLGVPQTILSDRGAEFTGYVWNQVQNILGCSLSMTSPYHPQGNSVCERSHRTVNNLLRATLASNPTSVG